MERHLETLFDLQTGYDEARIVVFGAPFDSTTSYRPGARFAGRVMRAESYGLETFSPYQEADLSEASVYDGGELELAIGDSGLALNTIKNYADKVMSDDKFPFMLGGEHLVSLGAIQAAVEKFPDLKLIHFDAHADLRDEYLGVKLSHASVIRRAWDILGDGRIFQFGIRSGERSEFEWAKTHTSLYKLGFSDLRSALREIGDCPVYLTVDLDVLDPSIFCGTGTPEAGGVSFSSLMAAILTVVDKARPVGMDLVELCPPYDPSGMSTAVALKILRETLIALHKKGA